MNPDLLKESNECRAAAKKIFNETGKLLDKAKAASDKDEQTEFYKRAMANNEKGFALEAKARRLYQEYLRQEREETTRRRQKDSTAEKSNADSESEH
jgi:hypothetical protein